MSDDAPHMPDSIPPATVSRIDSLLSAELLQIIFKACCVPIHPSANERRTALDPAIKISHVCHRWRKVAIDTPSLWVNVDRFHEDFKCFVDRAKDFPVFLTLREAEGTAPIAFPTWLEQLAGHVHSILAEGRATTVNTLLFYGLSHYLPSLVSLDLRATDADYAQMYVSAPQLRQLALRRVDGNLDNCACLTELTIEGTYSSVPPKASSLLNLLRKCPDLRLLDLSGFNTDVVDDDDSMSNPIQLPLLHTLKLIGLPKPTTTYLLSRIRIPSSAPLATHFQRDLASDTMLHLDIDTGESALLLSTDADCRCGLERFSWKTPGKNDFVFSDSEVAFHAVDFSSVESLYLHIDSFADTPTTNDFKVFLTRLPSLAKVAISMHRPCINNFIIALCNTESGVSCSGLAGFIIMDKDSDLPGNDPTNLARFTRILLQNRSDAGARCLDYLRFVEGEDAGLDWTGLANTCWDSVSQVSVHVTVI